MGYKELHSRYSDCVVDFLKALNSIETETSTYAKLGNDDLEVTSYGDCTKHYTHSVRVDDIILQ